jgi:hypothetical protein
MVAAQNAGEQYALKRIGQKIVLDSVSTSYADKCGCYVMDTTFHLGLNASGKVTAHRGGKLKADGSAYDLTKAGTVGLGGTGAGSYVIMNTGSVAGKFEGSAVNIQQSQWAISMYVMSKAWRANAGYIFEIDSDTGAGAYISNNNWEKIEGTTGGGPYQVYRSDGNASLDRWYHIVFQKPVHGCSSPSRSFPNYLKLFFTNLIF